jgi:hypothetical protein
MMVRAGARSTGRSDARLPMIAVALDEDDDDDDDEGVTGSEAGRLMLMLPRRTSSPPPLTGCTPEKEACGFHFIYVSAEP